MIHATSDPLLAQLAQQALHAQGFYLGAIDGAWGPASEAAFQAYENANLYQDASRLVIRLSAGQQADLAVFLKNWKTTDAQVLYKAVSLAANVPPALVAALHYRECPDFPRFSTYLHNGDPLRDAAGHPLPTKDVPAGLLFDSWTDAAIDAIERESTASECSRVEMGTTFLPALCVFAELYNGEGYRVRGVPDPYVLAGTSGYSKGKFTADGVYDPNAVDAECGVLVLLRAILPVSA